MNKCELLGRLTKDIELKETSNDKGNTFNKKYARFTLAVNRRGKDAGTDFIGCIAREKTAELLQKYCKKGSQIGVVGRIQTGHYTDKDKKEVYTTDIVAEELDIIWDNKEEDKQLGYSFKGDKNDIPPVTDEDLLF